MAQLFLEVLLYQFQLLVVIDRYCGDVHFKEAPYWEYERTVYHELTLLAPTTRLDFLQEFVRVMSMKATAGYTRGFFGEANREDVREAVTAFVDEHGPFDKNGTFRFRVIKLDQVPTKQYP